VPAPPRRARGGRAIDGHRILAWSPPATPRRRGAARRRRSRRRRPGPVARLGRAPPQRPLLPRVSLDASRTERDTRVVGVTGTVESDYLRVNPSTQFGIRLSWDLDQLVFSRDEPAAAWTASRLIDRREERVRRATRLYFQRRRLLCSWRSTRRRGAAARRAGEPGRRDHSRARRAHGDFSPEGGSREDARIRPRRGRAGRLRPRRARSAPRVTSVAPEGEGSPRRARDRRPVQRAGRAVRGRGRRFLALASEAEARSAATAAASATGIGPGWRSWPRASRSPTGRRGRAPPGGAAQPQAPTRSWWGPASAA